MYGHYALFSEMDAQGALSSSPYANYDLGQTYFNNNALFSMIHSFSPTWTSQSKVTLQPADEHPAGLDQPRAGAHNVCVNIIRSDDRCR